MKIPFLGPTNSEKSRDVDYQRTVNWYPEISQYGKGRINLYPTAGAILFSTIGIGPIRGSIKFNTSLYVVSRDTLYKVETTGSSTSIGTLSTTNGFVSMAHNGTEIIIVDGQKGYLYNEGTSTFTANISAVDADFPDGATHVVFMDSFFLVNDPSNVGRFYKSNSYDGLTWDALDFATAERSPDALQALVVNQRELWLLGTETSEVWYNTSVATFPFEPIQSGLNEFGCAAPHSVAAAYGTVMWLSQNANGQGLVVMSKGYSAQPVSTNAITDEIAGFSTIDDAFAYIYQEGNHIFYVLTFPTEDKTFVYDLFTEMWHEWSSTDADSRHLSNSYSFFDGKHIVGDRNNGKLYQLDFNTYTETGSKIHRLRRSAHIHSDDRPLFHRKFTLEMEHGVGDNTTTDPQVMLRWSDDGGHTWSNEYWRSIGAIGEYKTECEWRRLGRSDDRIYEVKVTDPIKPILINGYTEVDGATRDD